MRITRGKLSVTIDWKKASNCATGAMNTTTVAM